MYIPIKGTREGKERIIYQKKDFPAVPLNKGKGGKKLKKRACVYRKRNELICEKARAGKREEDKDISPAPGGLWWWSSE